MSFKQSSNTMPINIPNTRQMSFSTTNVSVDLDTIHFSPPELRDRVESLPYLHPDLQERIEISKSLPNLKIENFRNYQNRPYGSG